MRWLRDRPDAVEADLRRFYRVSRRDLGLVDTAHLLRHLPSEAVLSGNDGWSVADFLAADLVHVQTGKPHPSDPRVVRAAVDLRARVARAAARAAERRERLGIRGSVI